MYTTESLSNYPSILQTKVYLTYSKSRSSKLIIRVVIERVLYLDNFFSKIKKSIFLQCLGVKMLSFWENQKQTSFVVYFETLFFSRFQLVDFFREITEKG